LSYSNCLMSLPSLPIRSHIFLLSTSVEIAAPSPPNAVHISIPSLMQNQSPHSLNQTHFIYSSPTLAEKPNQIVTLYSNSTSFLSYTGAFHILLPNLNTSS